MRIVTGVIVIVTMSSGITTVITPEKQPSAQKSPHGERPYLSTNLCATWRASKGPAGERK